MVETFYNIDKILIPYFQMNTMHRKMKRMNSNNEDLFERSWQREFET